MVAPTKVQRDEVSENEEWLRDLKEFFALFQKDPSGKNEGFFGDSIFAAVLDNAAKTKKAGASLTANQQPSTKQEAFKAGIAELQREFKDEKAHPELQLGKAPSDEADAKIAKFSGKMNVLAKVMKQCSGPNQEAAKKLIDDFNGARNHYKTTRCKR